MDQKRIKKIVEELGIDRPIMRFEAVEPKRLLLHLYGGEVLELEEEGGEASPPLPKLHNLKVRELRKMAAELGIENAAKLRKAELIAALGAYDYDG